MEQEDIAAAQLYSEESLTRFREAGDETGTAAVLRLSGEVSVCQKDYATAHQFFSESLSLHRKQGDEYGATYALGGIGMVARAEGNLARARGIFQECLTVCLKVGIKPAIAVYLDEMAWINHQQGDPVRAAHLLGAAESMRESIGASILPVNRADYDDLVLAVRSAMGEEAFSSALTLGRAMTIEQAVDYSRTT